MPETNRRVLYLDCWSPDGRIAPAGLSLGGWAVDAASSIDEARRLLGQSPYRVGMMRVVRGAEERIGEAMELLGTENPYAEWVALVPRDSLRENGLGLARLVVDHCFDYHTLPIDPERLLITLGRAHGMSEARERALGDSGALQAEHEMVGVSPAMQQLFREIRKVASVDASVFIAGETGTGKELTARAIHERSRRRGGPFVAVECTALPPTLIHSELFGHEKGAFTGAARRKTGLIEAASGGTLFLDEIGDLPLDLQGNLLRFLQESTIQPVGSTEARPVDVRVVAATGVDLRKAVAEGRFREDLYFRLQVLCLRMPPLRERGADVELLARFFFDRFGRESASRLKGFSRQALRALREHDWPGNVRELINRVRRAIVMCEAPLIAPGDLGFEEPESRSAGPRQTLEAARAAAEREALQRALFLCGDNLSAAARLLGVSRVTVYQLLRKHELVRAERPDPAH